MDAFDFKKITQTTEAAHSATWHEYYKANLPHILNSSPVAALQKCVPGSTAVIVNAGPSLRGRDDVARRIDLSSIEKNRSKVILIAVDRAFDIVRDLHPDFILTCEWRDGIVQYFENIPHGLPAVVPVLTHPEVIQKLRSARANIFAYQPNPNSTEFGKYVASQIYAGCLTQGGTVGTVALSLAISMGCMNITVIGLDLKYDPRFLECKPEEAIHGKIKSTGEDFVSSPLFMTSLQWYMAMPVQYPEIRFFNSTAGGMPIQGFFDAPIDEFVSTLGKPNNIRSAIRKASLIRVSPVPKKFK